MKEKTVITTTKESLVGELKKHSIAYAILYGIVVGLVASMLIFCYFSVFSSNFYLKTADGLNMVAVVDKKSYESNKRGDIIYVRQYDSYADIAVGDEIYYSGNAGEGSGIVVEKHLIDGYLTVKTHEETFHVYLSTLVGKIASKTQFWGYILYFFQSVVGIVALNVLLVVIVAWRMIFIATRETSPKGKELKAKLKKQKRGYAKRLKTTKKYSETTLDAETFDVLSGTHEQNKQKLFEAAGYKDQANAYKFLLEKVYKTYLTKPQLTKDEMVKITNCIELMAVAYGFDEDVEYMINDLIIKSPVVDFDISAFEKTCTEEIVKTNSIENLERFCLSLYILVKLNKSLQTQQICAICDAVDEKLKDEKFVKNNLQIKENLQKLTEYIRKFVKK